MHARNSLKVLRCPIYFKIFLDAKISIYHLSREMTDTHICTYIKQKWKNVLTLNLGGGFIHVYYSCLQSSLHSKISQIFFSICVSLSYFLKGNMHINMYKLFLEHLVMIIQMWAYMLFIFYCVFKFYAMHMHFTFIFRKKNKAIPKSFQFKIHLNALKLKMLTYNVTNLTRNCWWFILTCDEDLVAYNFQ